MRLLLACLLLVSCGKNSSNAPAPAAGPAATTSASKVDKIDITDAANLFVTGTDSAGLYLTDGEVLKPKTLYKTTADGVVKEVTYSTNKGQDLPQVDVPSSIVSPDPSLVIMDFNGSSQYIVNKTTGKAYATEADGILADVVSDGGSTGLNLADDDTKLYGIKVDTLTGKRPLVSIGFEGDDLVLKELSAAGDAVEAFSKDTSDNFIYKAGSYKKRTADGKFSNLATLACTNTSSDGRILGYTKDTSGAVTTITNLITGAVVKEWALTKFLLKSTAASPTFSEITLVDAANNTVWCAMSTLPNGSPCVQITDTSPTAVIALVNASGKATASYEATSKTIEVDLLAGAARVGAAGWSLHEYKPQVCGPSLARIGSKVINNGLVGGLEVFDESNNSITLIHNAKLENIKASNNYVYGISSGVIQKVNIATKAVTPISIPNLLEVKSFTVNKADEITLNATLDDGSSFMGSVSAVGALTVLSKTGAGAVSIIAPLN